MFLHRPVNDALYLDHVTLAQAVKMELAYLPRFRRLPVPQYRVADFLQRRRPGGQTADDTHEVHAIGGPYRPGPPPRLEFREPLEEALAEHAVNHLRWRETKLRRQECAYSQRGGVGPRVRHRV